MDNFKIYSVTDEYIDYLRIIEPNVYSNKVENRIHLDRCVFYLSGRKANWRICDGSD